MSMIPPQYYSYAWPPANTAAAMPQNNYNQTNPIQPATATEIGPPQGTKVINGAAAFFQQVPTQQLSHVSIFLPISSALNGIREMIPSILLRGSEATKTLLEQCSARGIEVSPDIAGDKLQLSVSGPAGQEEELVKVAMHFLTRPSVDMQNFNYIKDLMIKNIQNLQSDPDVPLGEAVMKNLYGKDHPYAKGSQEMMEALSQLTPQAVMALHQQALQFPEQTRLIMLSPQPVEKQKALLDQGIQQYSWFASPYRSAPLPETPPTIAARGSKGPLLVPNETLEQAHIFTAWRAPVIGDPDYPAFCVMRELLEGSSGRFFKIMRTERGLVYGTSESYTGSQKQGADYCMGAQVDYENIDIALKSIQDVVQSIVNAPPSPAELMTAKKKFKLGMNSILQSTDGIAALSMPWLKMDLPPQHPSHFIAQIERITPADIQRVANRIFNPSYGYNVTGIAAPQNILAQWAQNRMKAQPAQRALTA